MTATAGEMESGPRTQTIPGTMIAARAQETPKRLMAGAQALRPTQGQARRIFFDTDSEDENDNDAEDDHDEPDDDVNEKFLAYLARANPILTAPRHTRATLVDSQGSTAMGSSAAESDGEDSSDPDEQGRWRFHTVA